MRAFSRELRALAASLGEWDRLAALGRSLPAKWCLVKRSNRWVYFFLASESQRSAGGLWDWEESKVARFRSIPLLYMSDRVGRSSSRRRLDALETGPAQIKSSYVAIMRSNE
jgi:hypothetical protein